MIYICFSQENGILEDYQLAPDGVHQARLAGQSFLKASYDLLFKNQEFVSFPTFRVKSMC